MPQIRKLAEQSSTFQFTGWRQQQRKGPIVTEEYTTSYVPVSEALDSLPDQPQTPECSASRESGWCPAELKPLAGAVQECSIPWNNKRETKVASHILAQPPERQDEGCIGPGAVPGHNTEGDDYHSGDCICGELTGQGQLVLLPDGSLTGHLIDPRSKCTYGVMARDVLSWDECTRDEEWRILRVTLLDFRTKLEASLLVERTGRDAIVLQAPLAADGLEPGLLRSISSPSDCSDAQFRFDCERIYAGPAAVSRLRAVAPHLCDLDAIVAVGDFRMAGLAFKPH